MIILSLNTFLSSIHLPGESKAMMKPLALDHMFLCALWEILGRCHSAGCGLWPVPTSNIPFLFPRPAPEFSQGVVFGFPFRSPVPCLRCPHTGHLVNVTSLGGLGLCHMEPSGIQPWFGLPRVSHPLPTIAAEREDKGSPLPEWLDFHDALQPSGLAPHFLERSGIWC